MTIMERGVGVFNESLYDCIAVHLKQLGMGNRILYRRYSDKEYLAKGAAS